MEWWVALLKIAVYAGKGKGERVCRMKAPGSKLVQTVKRPLRSHSDWKQKCACHITPVVKLIATTNRYAPLTNF